jgi:3-isopropylmalate/(R)-2-methylmalate dehydratase small subunit
MEKFVKHVGSGVPLRRSNVDTDQIIPAVYLKRVTRSGFEDGLFSAWRNDPEFVLNQEAYKKGTILVTGPEFGTGSSREHAVLLWCSHKRASRPSGLLSRQMLTLKSQSISILVR